MWRSGEGYGGLGLVLDVGILDDNHIPKSRDLSDVGGGV